MGQRRSTLFIIWTLVLLLSMPVSVLAQEAPADGSPLPDGFAMDLSSTQASMAAQNSQPVNIYTDGTLANGVITGGVAQTVNPGQMVTPAQFMAISQVMAGAQQTLVLSAAGAAAAGYASVSPATMSVLESLHIPAGVSLNSIGFNAATAFNVAGAATVNGALYAMQQNQAATAVMNLGSLLVGPGALVTTNLPAYSAMLGNVVASTGLTMNIAGTLTNYGTIATSGPLSVLAGGAIYNQTLAGMPQATMVAQSVAMSSLASTIVNSGIITALRGNISMASQLASNLSVLNTNGVMQALNGSINFRSSDFAGKFHLDVMGGDFVSQELNMYSGDGIVNLYANDVTGRVNITAGEAHVTAATNNLVLGNLSLSGDPTFYNTNPLGDVTIAGNLIFSGQDLAIVANRNVMTAPGAGLIDTSSTTNKGGSVTIVAGADFTAFYVPSGSAPASWPTSSIIVNPATPIANDQDLVLQINGPSINGGRIDLVAGAPINTFSTQSTAAYPSANASGGNVTLIAFQGTTPSDPDAGTIKLPLTLTITTGGGVIQPPAAAANVFPSGNFLAIAGGPNSGGNPAISMGSVDTQNTAMPLVPSQNGGGSVVIQAATPMLQGASPVFIRGGTIMSGNFVPNTSQFHNAGVSVKNIWATGAVQVLSGGSVSISGMLYTLPNFSVPGSPTDVLIAAGLGPTVNSATLSIGNVTTNGNSLSLISSAAIVSASGHSNLSISTFDTFTSGHTPMGAINIVAGAQAMPTSAAVIGMPALVQVGIAGPSAFPGNVNFSVPTAFASGPSYNVPPGGNLSMLSYSGTITLNNASTITTNGGTVTIIAGQATNQHLPNCTICLGGINAGSGGVFVATEQPQITGGFLGPTTMNLPVGNTNPSTAVPVVSSSIAFGGSVVAGGPITILAGFDIGFPAVSSVGTAGQLVTLAAGIAQDPGTTLPAPYNPVNPGALVLGANGSGESVTVTGLTPQVTLVAGVNLTVPGTVQATGGTLAVIVAGNLTALPTTATTLKVNTTGSATMSTLQNTPTQLFGIVVGGTFTLAAQGLSSSIGQTATPVQASVLDLSAGTGGINITNTNAGTLKFSTTGSVSWTDTSPSVNLSDSTVTGTLTGNASAANSSITQVLGSTISAGGLNLTNGTGDIDLTDTSVSSFEFHSNNGTVTMVNSASDLSISADSSAGNVYLTTDGTFTLTNDIDVTTGNFTAGGSITGTATFVVDELSLESTSGGIDVTTQSGSVVVSSASDVTIANTGSSVSVDIYLSTPLTLTVTNNNDITTNTDLTTVSSISLTTTGNNGEIDLGGNLNADDDINLETDGTGSISSTGTVTTDVLTLKSDAGNVVSLYTQANSLNFTTTGTVSVNNLASVLSINQSSGSIINIDNRGAIHVTGSLTANTSVDLSTDPNINGNIEIFAGIQAPTVTLTNYDSGTIEGTGLINAGTCVIASGELGYIDIKTSTPFVSAQTAGTIKVGNSGYALSFTTSGIPTSLNISNNNSITASNQINVVNGVVLTTTANNGSIYLADDASFGSSSTANLTTNGSGTITQQGGHTIIGGLLSLNTGGGSVGLLQTQVSSLTASIPGSGTLGVSNTGSPLALSSVSAQSLSISNNDDIYVSGAVSGTGSVSLTTTAGSNGNIVLDAPVGDGGALVAIVTLTADGSIVNGNSTPVISGQSVALSSAAAIIGTPLSHLQVTARTLTATPFPPGTNNVDWLCCNPTPAPGPTPAEETGNDETTVFNDLISSHDEISRNDSSIVNGDGSPAVTPTDATPQSHDFPVNWTSNQPSLNLGAETNEQLQTGIPGAAATGSASVSELQSQGVHLGTGSTETYMILNQGNILFQPNHDITVQVQEGHVFIPDGAVAFVIETGHDVAVFDMHDGKKGPVRVRAGKQMITLAPGKQLVLTRQLEADFDSINPEKLIAHRNVQTVATTEGIRIYSADFSLPSMMMNVSPLKRMLASDNPSERRQARKLLKNAVVLAQLSGQKGAYNNSSSSH